MLCGQNRRKTCAYEHVLSLDNMDGKVLLVELCLASLGSPCVPAMWLGVVRGGPGVSEYAVPLIYTSHETLA